MQKLLTSLLGPAACKLRIGRRAAWCLAAALVVVSAAPGVASASVVRPLRLGPAGLLQGRHLRLSQAPAGLRAAVHRALSVPPPSSAGSLQQGELRAPDGASNDAFGTSVAVSGNTAVVGAPSRDSSTGAAYMFTRSGSKWTERATLTASDGAAGDEFGQSVAIAGSTVVLGAPGRNSSAGVAYVFTGSGSAWTQRAELSATDGVPGDGLGGSVAISGSTVVLGASARNSHAGAAYVFSGSGAKWTQQGELTASDGATNDLFGLSVAISGSTVVVGAPYHNGQAGAAYVFVHSAGKWAQRAELSASDAASGDAFGASVAMSGTTVVVGAPYKNSYVGAAYVFSGSGSAWSQQAELTGPNGQSDHEFGWSVGISGSTLAVGEPYYGTGMTYAYMPSGGGGWSLESQLYTSDGSSGDRDGWSVAVSGSTIVSGAPAASSGAGTAYVFVVPFQQSQLTDPPLTGSGAGLGYSVAISGSTAVVGAPDTSDGTALVFVHTSTGWTREAELSASDGASSDSFGYAVAISGSTIVVGAYERNSYTGAAYVFTGSGSTWSQQAELTASDGATNHDFGYAVAISGSTVLVGAPGADSGHGVVYAFTGSGGTWSQRAELTASDGASYDQFGTSLATSGSTVVVGAPGADTSQGKAYVFTGSGSTWSQRAELTASDGAANDAFGWAVAISGSTVVVGAPGVSFTHGEVYVFLGSGGSWTQEEKLGSGSGGYGYAVAIAGSTLLVGAPDPNSGQGAAYDFSFSTQDGWVPVAYLTASDGAAGDGFGASVALLGSTAVIGAPNANSYDGEAYTFGSL